MSSNGHDWFQWYVGQVEKNKAWAKYRERYLCPCCFMPTLHSRAEFDMCNLCSWEDDGQDSDDADTVRGGPNADYSLREAKENFRLYFTMYRPDTRPFLYDQMDRPAREQLHCAFSAALSSGTDANWQRALDLESQIEAAWRRQERYRH
jgi:cysteine-rich CPCC protein